MGYIPSRYCGACGEPNHHGPCAKTIAYQRTCQKCQGAGEVPYNDGTQARGFATLVKCGRCRGTGKIAITYRRE